MALQSSTVNGLGAGRKRPERLGSISQGTATSSGQQCSAAHNPRSTATPDHVAHLKSWLFRNRPSLSVVSTCPTGKALRSRARCMQCVSALHADRVREGQATRSSCVFSMRACLFERVKGGFIGIHTCCIHYRRDASTVYKRVAHRSVKGIPRLERIV